MFHLLGHIPVEGESVETEGFVLQADRVQGRRISRVRISRVRPDGTEADTNFDADTETGNGSRSGDRRRPVRRVDAASDAGERHP
jgi:hypothetical protein